MIWPVRAKTPTNTISDPWPASSTGRIWYARARVLEWYEPDLGPWDMIGLGVAGYPDWMHCRECGAVAPAEASLHVDLERRDVTRRVCNRCADRNAEYDGCKIYTETNVAGAKDDRVQLEGGQRNLAGEYTNR